jgi:hypothetical protein
MYAFFPIKIITLSEQHGPRIDWIVWLVEVEAMVELVLIQALVILPLELMEGQEILLDLVSHDKQGT